MGKGDWRARAADCTRDRNWVESDKSEKLKRVGFDGISGMAQSSFHRKANSVSMPFCLTLSDAATGTCRFLSFLLFLKNEFYRQNEVLFLSTTSSALVLAYWLQKRTVGRGATAGKPRRSRHVVIYPKCNPTPVGAIKCYLASFSTRPSLCCFFIESERIGSSFVLFFPTFCGGRDSSCAASLSVRRSASGNPTSRFEGLVRHLINSSW